MVFDDDLTAEFSASDPFCVLGTFTVAGPATVAVYGRFIESTEAVNFATGELEAYDNSFECRTSEITSVKNGNTVVINAVTYEVKRKQNLGIGVSLVYLKTQ